MDRAYNLWGVIASEPHYTKQYGAKFVVPPICFFLYDNSIARDATNSKVCKAEANHTAKRTDCALYDASNKGRVQLIMDVVRYTW